VLLTVTSSHLFGIESVKKRLTELRGHLSADTEWIHAVTKLDGLGLESPEIQSCLPCHSVYFLAALHIANERGIEHIAAGYTGYQSAWLEQTPYALERVTKVMASVGKTFLVPVQDVSSKDEAKSILRSHNLSDVALEQKCMRQQFNAKEIPPDIASEEIDTWGRKLERVLALSNAPNFVEIRGSLTFREGTA
jgi:hypothetical protein